MDDRITFAEAVLIGFGLTASFAMLFTAALILIG
jgi:hypothetical protein